MMPPQSDYHALLAGALAVYIERGLPLSWPYAPGARGVTVQNPNGSHTRRDDVELARLGVMVLAEEYRSIVGELRRQERRGQWVWYPGRGLARER